MKVKVKEDKKKFEPITIELVIESAEELRNIRNHITNHGPLFKLWDILHDLINK